MTVIDTSWHKENLQQLPTTLEAKAELKNVYNFLKRTMAKFMYGSQTQMG